MASRVLITDAVAPVCLSLLEASGFDVDIQLKQPPEKLKELVKGADGWIIRSGTTITEDLIEAADQLKVIGRAGVGVDNVDLEAATRKGILVINAPDGNTISTAEHTCAMLMALSRRIPRANASLVDGRWDRKQFTGAELEGKTLGVIGVGKIGRAVAERMKGFGMQIIGFDPVLSNKTALSLGIELKTVNEVIAQSDYITVHTPLNDHTRGLLGEEAFKICKDGVYLANCARGGIIDEVALLSALESGKVAGAALDVYSQEPPPAKLAKLIQHPRVVATPHIAASTEEAQEKVARQITEQVIHALRGEPVMTSVNAMAIKMAAQSEVKPYLGLAEKLGRLAGQLTDKGHHLEEVKVICKGDIPHRYSEVLTVAVLKGLLGSLLSEPVNLINAPVLAKQKGLRVVEERVEPANGGFSSLLKIRVKTRNRIHSVAGTLFGADDPRMVQMDDYDVEVRLEGRMLLYRNEDRPGMVAAAGNILAEADINIGTMQLGRHGKRGSMALTALCVDEDIPEAILKKIGELEGVSDVRWVQMKS